MVTRTVLVSGAGVAGSTVAFWLARKGFRVTVAERAAGLRSSGAPVDVRGDAVRVAEEMGVLEALRAAATEVTETVFVSRTGRCTGRMDMRAFQGTAGGREVELPRADLVAALHGAGRDDVEYLFGDSITALHQDDGGVDVTLDRAGQRRFDLVIGADGAHSAVRGLVFAPERDCVRHLGIYLATLAIDDPVPPGRVVIHNMPGRAVAIHPARNRPGVMFLFRADQIAHLDRADVAAHKRIVWTAFAGGGWRVPELLERVDAADDLYFDAVSEIAVTPWVRGRVVLLGDAASCVSLFGEGSSMAMIGAHTLACAVAAGDLRGYETRHWARVAPTLRGVGQASALLLPATGAGIVARNLATRLWPVAAAAGWAGRRLRYREPVNVG